MAAEGALRIHDAVHRPARARHRCGGVEAFADQVGSLVLAVHRGDALGGRRHGERMAPLAAVGPHEEVVDPAGGRQMALRHRDHGAEADGGTAGDGGDEGAAPVGGEHPGQGSRPG